MLSFSYMGRPPLPEGPSVSRPLMCSIAVELDGQIYVGTFTVDGTSLTVLYGARARSIDLGNFSANLDILARHVLGELVEETRRVGSLSNRARMERRAERSPARPTEKSVQREVSAEANPLAYAYSLPECAPITARRTLTARKQASRWPRRGSTGPLSRLCCTSPESCCSRWGRSARMLPEFYRRRWCSPRR